LLRNREGEAQTGRATSIFSKIEQKLTIL